MIKKHGIATYSIIVLAVSPIITSPSVQSYVSKRLVLFGGNEG